MTISEQTRFGSTIERDHCTEFSETAARKRVERRLHLCIVVAIVVFFILYTLTLFAIFRPGTTQSSSESRETSTTVLPIPLDDRAKPFWGEKKVAQAIIDGCGGILNIPSNGHGTIFSGDDSSHRSNERCLWIVKSEAKKVRLTMRKYPRQYDALRDGFVIGELDSNEEELNCKTWSGFEDDSDRTVFQTPLIIYFTSTGTPKQTAWTLRVTPVEDNGWHEDQVKAYFVNKRASGFLPVSASPVRSGSLLGAIAAFQPVSTNRDWRRNLTCSPGVGSYCCDSATAYQMMTYNEGGYCIELEAFRSEERNEATASAVVILFWFHEAASTGSNCYISWSEQ